MKKIYLIAVSLSLTFSVFGQKFGNDLETFITTANEKQLVKESSDQMLNGFYNNADKVVDELLRKDNNSENYNYRKGYVSFMLNKSPKEVIKYLSKATNNVKKNYDIYSVKNNSSTDVFYYLGVSYQNIEMLDSAEFYFNKYNDYKQKKAVLYRYSQLRVKQLANAKQKIAAPNNDILVTNLGAVVNTNYPEYGQVPTLDGTGLYFTSRKPWGGDTSTFFISPEEGLYPEDIYLTYKNGEVWETPTRLTPTSPMYNEAIVTIDASQKRIYSYSDSTGRGDFYYSDLSKTTNPTRENLVDFTGVNNKKAWETSLFFSKDGKKMYFTSDRKGGYGGRDLYYCNRNDDGTWSDPINMGPGVNTAFDEDSPFITEDGKYFIYSSNNELSMGGFDIFYAPINSNGSVGNGKPLDYPLNTTADDVFYISSSDNYRGFLTSSRMDTYGDKDIYEIDMNYIGLDPVRFAKISFASYDENEPLPDDLKVRFICNDCDVKSKEVTPREKDLIVLTQLEPCKEYFFEYLTNNEVFKTDTVKTECDIAKQEITKQVIVGEPKEEIIEVLPELISEFEKPYGYNKNVISKSEKEYKEMISNVKTLLKEDKEAQIIFEIYSSASHVPTKTYKTNENLTQLRANNAMKTLITEFSKDEDMFARINITIKDASVNGPDYDNDANNIGKYAPFQYVKIKAIKK